MPPPARPTTTVVVASRCPPGRVLDACATVLTSSAAAAAAVDAVLTAHARLPPTGKPPPGQWTPLAGFAVVRVHESANADSVNPAPSDTPPPSYTATCVALGTGSKCVGATRRSRHGDTVNDGHAEAVARRALVRWLVAQLLEGGGGLFERRDGASDDAACVPIHFARAPGWALHMVMTALPCGDAAIVDGGGVTGARALVSGGADDESGGADDESGRADDESNWSPGAATAPPHHPRFPPSTAIDVAAQAAGDAASIGAPRRKPGRGPPTLSMSCSDKLARWTCVGVQGALVGRVLAGGLYVDAVTVVGEEDGGLGERLGGGDNAPSVAAPIHQHSTLHNPPARLHSLSRALVDRVQAADPVLPPRFTRTPPVLHVALATARALSGAGVAPPRGVAPPPPPAPTSTGWARVRQPGGNWEPPDVVVGSTGRKAGAVKRKQGSAGGDALPRALLPALCKRAAYERWRGLVRALGGTPPTATYGAAKRAAGAYQTASAAVRGALGGWILKPPELEAFGGEAAHE